MMKGTDGYAQFSEEDESDFDANQDAEDDSYQLSFRGNEYNQHVEDTQKETRDSPWTGECLSRMLVLFILLIIALGFGIHIMPPVHSDSDEPIMSSEMHQTEHVFHTAAVAAGQQECSVVGVDILKKGGNAVDAAIAALLCQGVVEPYFMGIGGGFGMTIYNKTLGKITVINARERAPAAVSMNTFIGKYNLSINGGMAVAVPGELKGYRYAYEKYGGGVPWADLFTEAINKARHGFKVSGSMAMKLQDNKAFILPDPLFCELYCNTEKNDLKKLGDTVINTRLANTLENVQKNGVDDFYTGEMAKSLIAEIKSKGGIMAMEDLKNYQVIEEAPFAITLPNAGLSFYSASLPFGGPVLGGILSVIDKYNVKPEDFNKNKALYWHRVVEAFKHTYGVRYGMGDSKFEPSALEVVEYIRNGSFANDAVSKISDDRTFNDPLFYGAKFYNQTVSNDKTTSTSHLSVLSPDKDAVSVTSTINFHFGAKFMSESTGLVFNNEMNDFAIPGVTLPQSQRCPRWTPINNLFAGMAYCLKTIDLNEIEILDGAETQHDKQLSAANLIGPNKRPLSSMSPSIFLDDDNNAHFIIGAAGGITIPTCVAMSMLRLLYFEESDFDEPIKEPRLHHSLLPMILKYETAFDKDILKSLAERGHELQEVPIPKNEVNGIKNHGSHIHAYSDERNEGAGPSGW